MIPETTPVGSDRVTSHVDFERDRGVSHVSVRSGVGRLSIYADDPRREMAHIFALLSEAGINVFLIKIHEDCIGFAVEADEVPRCVELCETQALRYAVVRRCALVSVVAPSMRDLSGVLWRIIGSFWERQIEVLELADAYNAVSCLVQESDAEVASRTLAEVFGVEVADKPGPLDPW